jgi:fermentation-respiration switch protein FrsA (DUF1100 family)
MRSSLLLLIAAGLTLGALLSCDVDAALLRGAPEAYNFPPSVRTDSFAVDADKIHLFQLTSQAVPEHDVVEAKIWAVYVGDLARINQDTVILYLHGNANSMNGFWGALRQLANLGGKHHYGVLCYDYRGFGNSDAPSTGLYSMESDLYAAEQWLVDHGLTDDRFFVFANSLGTLPASREAGLQTGPLTISKLTLESPQSHSDLFFQDAVGLSVPSTFATDYSFNLVDGMAAYEGELQWFHGLNDDVALVENARLVYEAHQGRYKEAFVIAEVGHGFRWDWGFENWGNAVLNFMRHE